MKLECSMRHETQRHRWLSGRLQNTVRNHCVGGMGRKALYRGFGGVETV